MATDESKSKVFDLVVVGHIAIDRTIIGRESRISLGGPPAYAMAAKALGLNKVGLVTTVGSDFPVIYENLLINVGMDLEGLRRGNATTRFVNQYSEDGRRTQQVATVADSIDQADIPSAYWNTRWIHISPILQEVDSHLITIAKHRGIKVSVDTQGFVRCHNKRDTQQVEPCPWKEYRDVAKDIDILKADVEEIYQLTGETNLETAAQFVCNLSDAIIIITDGPRGSYIYLNNVLHKIPALPPQRIVDQTGCGDVYAISFLVENERTRRPLWASYFAAAYASYNVETLGPIRFPSHRQVTNRLKEFLAHSSNHHHAELLIDESTNIQYQPSEL